MSSISFNGHVASQPAVRRSTPFRATLMSEWAKLVGVRSTWVLLLLAAVLSVGMTSLLTWATGWSWNEWTEADKAVFDPLMTSFAGLLFGGILGIVIAVRMVASEYASGMIRLTLQVTPNRTQVLLAKMSAVGMFLIVPLVLITFATIQSGQLILGSYGVPTVAVFEGETFRTVLLTGLSGVLFPVMAVPVTFIFRSSAASITTLLAMMVMPALFGGMFPRSVQENVLAWLPGPAIDAWTIGHLDPGYPMYLDRPLAVVATVGWVIGLTVVSARLLNRRDV